MSFYRLSACALVGFMSASGVSAATFTLNNMNAFCVSGQCTNLAGKNVSIANNLGAGAVYGLIDPSFVDGNGNGFAAKVTVEAVGGPKGANASSINTTQVNAWVHYSFQFVESFDINTLTFGADTSVAGIEYVNIEDIDSNKGQNFTDVAGVNLRLAGYGSALEVGGFLDAGVTGVATPDANSMFNFVRLAQGADASWADSVNVKAAAPRADKDTVSATFATDGDLSGFDFIWGSTGDARGNVRGWDMSIDAAPLIPDDGPEISPVPVPASLPLLLGAMGGMVLLRRRQRAG